MRKLLTTAGVAAALALFAFPSAAASDDGGARTMARPRPAWLTPELEARIVAAGPRGVEVPLAPGQAALDPNCLGTAPPYVGTDGVPSTLSSPAPAWLRRTAAR